MKILNRLTIKHLLLNKKRTIVTIIGITLSMALMLGCGLLASSFIEEMKLETIMSSGSYHVSFNNLSNEQANTLIQNINVADYYYFNSLGFANFTDTENESKPYYHIVSGSEKLLNSLNLLNGRMPENDQEVVLSDHISYNGGKKYEIGDTIDLDIGPRIIDSVGSYVNEPYVPEVGDTLKPIQHKTFKIVGIVSRTYVEDYSAGGYTIFSKADDISKDNPIQLFLEFKNPKDAYELGSEIENNLSLEPSMTIYNSGLLYYYGTTRYNNINESIVSILVIALSLLSVGCIIVIYNSFAISTMERKKQFGLYSSIGATKKQILHTVFFEAFVVGIIGILLGILGSFLGIYIVLQVLNHLLKDIWAYEFTLVIDWLFILIPIGFMILVVFFSAYIPAKRSSRVSPIVAIRENDDIKMPKRKLKTPKWITKVFGIEGELALKNMKRNKKKYRITVLSLFISIVLFISFSTYLKYGVSTMNTIDFYDFDMQISTTVSNYDQLKEIQKDPRINESYLFIVNSLLVEVPVENYTKEFRDFRRKIYEVQGDKDFMSLSFIVLEDDVFTNYASKVQATLNDAIILNEGQFVFYEDNNRMSYHKKYFERLNSKLGICEAIEECENDFLSVVYTQEFLPTFKYLSYGNELTAFVSQSYYQKLSKFFQIYDYEGYSILQMNSTEYQTLYDELNGRTKNITVFSPKKEFNESKNVVLAIKVLLYGFISLVTLIGVTSVFNTIHTSINLRRKEFAMLRSMGLTPNGFNKMIIFESLFFGLKSLLYGLPVSFIFVLLIHNSMTNFAQEDSILIPWGAVLLAVFGVFLIVLLAMIYSVNKIKKENILDSIRDENI